MSDGDFLAARRDDRDQLTSMTKPGGAVVNLAYDPLGRLWQVSSSSGTTRFFYDGDALVIEYDGAGNVPNRYAHGSNAAVDDPLVWFSGSGLLSPRWLHADHLGSIVAMTDSSGANPAIDSYDEYGIPASTNTGRFQYTGQAWIPEIGMYYYKARIYSPTLGRFIQTDPVGYDGGINIYEYALDDPVDGGEPTGLFDCPNENQCSSISNAINSARQAALTPDTGSRMPSAQGLAIAKGLEGLGTAHNEALGQHDANGVTIANGSLTQGTPQPHGRLFHYA